MCARVCVSAWRRLFASASKCVRSREICDQFGEEIQCTARCEQQREEKKSAERAALAGQLKVMQLRASPVAVQLNT